MWNNAAAPALSAATMDAAVSYGLWQPSGAGNHVIAAAGYGRVARFMSVSAGIKYFPILPTTSLMPADLYQAVLRRRR